MHNYLILVFSFITTAFSGIATLTAACIAAFIANKFQKANLRIVHEKMEKELFKEFNDRYDKLNDHLAKLSSSMELSSLDDEYYLGMRNIVVDYFNLCAEQYYWYKKGRISETIWTSWHSGMMHYYNTFPVIRELWECETKDGNFKSYYLTKNIGFFES